MEELGALWIGRSKNGKTYFTGTVAGERVVMFKNGYKEDGDNKPFYHVYKSEDRPGQGGQREEYEEPETEQEEIPFDDDDIPF